MLTVLIIEDDLKMRRVLRKITEENKNLRVVGEAADGLEALVMFEELRPDVIFIDIELPGKDGITLAQELFELNPWTRLVFITAYDQYRGEAFSVYACDYIVKPFKIDRLRQTLDRLCLICSGQMFGRSLTGSHLPKLSVDTIRLFQAKSKMVVLELKDILFITREGRRTVVYHTKGQLETNDQLNTLSQELSGHSFMRTHKGFIVNLRMLREIIPINRWTYELVVEHTAKRPLLTSQKLRELEQALTGKKST